MQDYIVRGTAANGQVRFFAAYTKEMVETARQTHNTSPVATAALGRLLTGGAMMGAMCKNEKDILTLQIQCSGPIGGLTVTADANANVKGYAIHPQVMLPPSAKGKLDVGGALDLGVLSVIKDIGLKEPYVGQIPLTTGEIAEDLTQYFAVSEQTATAVALGVLMEKDNTVKQAGGFIVQMLPQEDSLDELDAIAEVLEGRLQKFSSVTTLLEQGMTPEQMMEELFEGYDVCIHDTIPTKYACNCSKERVYGAVASIGKADLQQMIDDDEPIEVNCHFCNKHYIFGVDELQSMLNA